MNTTPAVNAELAARVLDALSAAGVREVCLCAGARDSPLVSLLPGQGRFRALHFFEERSAAFFALGRIKATGRPVAVVTTSGTAAGELLPATMEAYYSGLPLLLVTADRPRRFRGSGAPQTAEQAGLFGVYAEPGLDIAGDERFDLGAWSRTRPAHVNVCFEEPLPGISGAPDAAPERHGVFAPEPPEADPQRALSEARARLGEFMEESRSPVVIVGGLTPAERGPALELLLALDAPVIAESLSGLREHPALQRLMLRAGKDALVPKRAGGGSSPWMDGVLRIGSVPTLRLWRDVEDTFSHLPLLSLSAQPFPGASRGALVHAPLSRVLGSLAAEVAPVHSGNGRHAALMTRDRALAAAMRRLLEAEPRSEPGLISRLSGLIPPGARLFLGNSLPVREWDLAATWEPRGLEIGASRGLNGIDGQLSTFLGFSEAGGENWALLGDLTAMYDMAAPWILAQMPEVGANIVVVNNGGGKIFERMFPDPAFQNRHTLSFGPLAQFWHLEYQRWETVPGTLPLSGRSLSGRSLIEVVPDADATRRFWQAADSLAAGIGEAA